MPKTAAAQAQTLIGEDMVGQYMQLYPDKSREEIIAAIQKYERKTGKKVAF
jgi:hypothetical protein